MADEYASRSLLTSILHLPHLPLPPKIGWQGRVSDSYFRRYAAQQGSITAAQLIMTIEQISQKMHAASFFGKSVVVSVEEDA